MTSVWAFSPLSKIKLMLRQRIIAAATDFTVTRERSAVISFGEPIMQVYNCLFIKNPEGTPNYFAYTNPLRNACWLVVGILVLVTPPFLYMAVW